MHTSAKFKGRAQKSGLLHPISDNSEVVRSNGNDGLNLWSSTIVVPYPCRQDASSDC